MRSRAIELGQHLEIDAAGEVGIEARVLDEPGDAVEDRRTTGIRAATEQLHRPFVGPHEPKQEPKQSRFAGPIRTQQTSNLALVDEQVHIVNCPDWAEPLDETPG